MKSIRFRPTHPNYSLTAKFRKKDVEAYEGISPSRFSEVFEETSIKPCVKSNVNFIEASVLIPAHKAFMKLKYSENLSGGFEEKDCVIRERNSRYIRISGFDDPEADYFYFCKDTWDELTDEGAIFTLLGKTCLFINGELMPAFPLKSKKFNVFGPELLKKHTKGKCISRAGTADEPPFILSVCSELTVVIKS